MLQSYHLLDTPPEPGLDALTRAAALLTEMPISAISLIDRDRQWFKARYGTELQETRREIAFCATTIESRDPLVIPDARNDVRFRSNPLVTEAPGIRFYAGFPLIGPSGLALGSLCVIDTRPRELPDHHREVLSALALQVQAHFDLRRSDLQAAAHRAQTGLASSGLRDEVATTLDGMRQAEQSLRRSDLDADQQELLTVLAHGAEHLGRLTCGFHDDLHRPATPSPLFLDLSRDPPGPGSIPIE